MTEEQHQKCLHCIYRNKRDYSRYKICNIRGKDLNFEGDCDSFVADKEIFQPPYNRFKLYQKKKPPKFRWNNEYTLITYFLILMLLYLFNEKYIYLYSKPIVILFGLSWLALYFYLSYDGFTKRMPFDADYVGEMLLLNDKIKMANQIYPLSEIKQIYIKGEDYIDKLVNVTSLFDSYRSMTKKSRSNGYDNTIKIFLKNGQIFTKNFQMPDAEALVRNRPLLIHYYKKGILTQKNLIALLKLNKKISDKEFEAEIH